MLRILEQVHIPSFTDEDLLSFMHLKVHQMLRRDQLDPWGSIHGVVYTSLRNLMRDVVRMQDRAWSRGMETDPIDHTLGSQDATRRPLVTISYSILEGQEESALESV